MFGLQIQIRKYGNYFSLHYRCLKIREIRISGLPDFRISGIAEIRISGVPEFRKSGFPDFRKSGNPEFRIYGILEMRNSGDPDIRISGLQIQNPYRRQLSSMTDTDFRIFELFLQCFFGYGRLCLSALQRSVEELAPHSAVILGAWGCDGGPPKVFYRWVPGYSGFGHVLNDF